MLKEKLKEDMKAALKSGDTMKRMLLGMVLSSVKNREFDKRAKLSKTITETTELEKAAELNDEETLEVVASEIKRRKDSVAEYTKGGRPELAEGEQKEADLLMAYMPEQMSDDAIQAEVKKAISETGATSAKDMGKVIGAVMPKVKGKADGNRVSQIVKELLK